MSTVTGMVFTCGILDEDKLPLVNAIIRDTYEVEQNLVDVTKSTETGKALQGNVWIGAYNHFDEDAFFRKLPTIAWEQPDAVRVFLHYEHEDGFTMTKDVRGNRL